jgi:hypothetical protein
MSSSESLFDGFDVFNFVIAIIIIQNNTTTTATTTTQSCHDAVLVNQ